MEDTIVAISTSLSPSAISIIRLSGQLAIKIVNSIFKGKDLTKVPTHTIHYGFIVNNKQNIDEVLVTIMKGPKTYTKEDVVEINCHGGVIATKKVLELLLSKNCRLAEPGEFTKRAYLNGRIDLLEAESINDLIMAKSEALQKMSLNNMGGLLTKKIENIREKLVKIISNIEVNIDYPEYEDEVIVTDVMIAKFLKEIIRDLEKLISDSKSGQIIKNGINIAIIGKPNVGKSSILNYLLDEEKAIVTDIPGTTRDAIEGSISLDGVLINFIDTAGIRKTKNIVEQKGVDKSKKIADNSNLILFVLNNNEKITKEELILLNSFKKDKVLIFVNKTDLDNKLDINKLKDFQIVSGNTIEPYGLNDLKDKIKRLFELDKIVCNEMSYLSNIRQINLINKANESLKNAMKSYYEKMPIDLIEIDLRKSWELLGELIGVSYDEELIDNIFSHFCLGK